MTRKDNNTSIIHKFMRRLKRWVNNPNSEPEIEKWYQDKYLRKGANQTQTEQPVTTTDINLPAKSNQKEINFNNNTISPVEILLLHYVNGKPEQSISFPGYFQYRYEVNPHQLLKQLINKGLLTLQNDPVKNMQKTKVDDLKEILKKKSLKVTGRKNELIRRIIENHTPEELKSLFPRRIYQPTEQGLKILNENDHIWFFHSQSHVDVSIYEAHKEKKAAPHLSKFEIGYKILEQKAKSYFKQNNFGLYRNALLGISILQEKEGRKKDALCNLFAICYIDLSGTGNNFNKLFMDIYEQYFFPYEKSLHTLAPGIVSKIAKLKDELNLTPDDMKEIYYQSVSSVELPFHLFTKEETYQILIEELNENKEALKKIYQTAQRRYKRNKKLKAH